MCLVAFAYRQHPRYPLAVIANRDELHARPTAIAGVDAGDRDLYGGRDLAQGGGWLMVSRRGRLAAVTNVRVPPLGARFPRSRGALVRDFVADDAGVDAFLDGLAPEAGNHGPFNLVLWDGQRMACAGNHPGFARQAVAPGLHAVSNGPFDAPWPKSNLASRALSAWIDNGLPADARGADVAPLLDALAATAPAPDPHCPTPASAWHWSGGCRRRSCATPSTARAAVRSCWSRSTASASSSGASGPMRKCWAKATPGCRSSRAWLRENWAHHHPHR